MNTFWPLSSRPRPVPIPLQGTRRSRPDTGPTWLPWLVLALLSTLVLGARASSRGTAQRVELWTDQTALEAGERYAVHLLPGETGFLYLYSLDARGMVRLIYPLTPEDGRGEVEAGRSFSIEPVVAGSLPGREKLVAVHTREYRRIKPARREFLAPDPADLQDIHFRITRDIRELEAYSELDLTIDGPLAQAEPEAEGARPGITVHDHAYDYWCDYCDLWHPSCTLDHCWCGWQVGLYYHGHYHHHHCGWWGPRHWWWNPPVVYVYVEGGSPWDYDSGPWRERDVWRRQRYYSQEWRQLQQQRVKDQAPPEDTWPRKPAVYADRDLRSVLKEAREDQPRSPLPPKVLSTHPAGQGSPGSPLELRTAPARRKSVGVSPAPVPAAPPVLVPAQPVPQPAPQPSLEPAREEPKKPAPARRAKTLSTKKDESGKKKEEGKGKP